MNRDDMPPGVIEREAASFRDPAGFVYQRDGVIYRQINLSGREDYDLLMDSGLYATLVEKGWLVPHQEVDIAAAQPEKAYKTIQPEPIPFISYPYEWSFSQLKDAARLTIAVQKEALRHRAILKDSSAYNIQFLQGKPVLVDTLSFSPYEEGAPWIGYRQFCQHFLAPLALMSLTDVRLAQLLRTQLDGLPLDLASKLLPWRTRLLGGLYLHIHLHASAQKRYAGRAVRAQGQRRVSKIQLTGLLDSLENNVNKLQWDPASTGWADYDRQHNYSPSALDAKKTLVKSFLEHANPAVVWDLGANTGEFSLIAAERAHLVVSFDSDPGATEINYLARRANGPANILPLVMDLTNPSPGTGWHNRERKPLEERASPDLVMGLALIHHLAISNNLPLAEIAAYLAATGEWLLVEFVPKEDSQVQKLLASRLDIFPDYHEAGFEAAFERFFNLERKERLPDSGRALYLFRRLS